MWKFNGSRQPCCTDILKTLVAFSSDADERRKEMKDKITNLLCGQLGNPKLTRTSVIELPSAH